MFQRKKTLRIHATITHDGNQWIAYNSSFRVAGNSMEDLDEQVKRKLEQSGILPFFKKVHVFMACDNEIIPGWMRPFHNHYFNRILEIENSDMED